MLPRLQRRSRSVEDLITRSKITLQALPARLLRSSDEQVGWDLFRAIINGP